MAYETEDHETQYCFPDINSSCIKGKRSKYEYNITICCFIITVNMDCVSEPAGDHLHLSLQEASHSNQPDHSLSGCGRPVCLTDCDACGCHKSD